MALSLLVKIYKLASIGNKSRMTWKVLGQFVLDMGSSLTLFSHVHFNICLSGFRLIIKQFQHLITVSFLLLFFQLALLLHNHYIVLECINSWKLCSFCFRRHMYIVYIFISVWNENN